jgi:hypothetical protein
MIRSLGLRRQTSLRILEVEPIQTEPYVPRSHPFIKRLIGTIRREYLDHCFFWNANVNTGFSPMTQGLPIALGR